MNEPDLSDKPTIAQQLAVGPALNKIRTTATAIYDHTEQVNALAREIADGCAEDVLINLGVEHLHGVTAEGWYSVDAADTEFERSRVARASRYLELRGLLEHHPEHWEWVRVKR